MRRRLRSAIALTLVTLLATTCLPLSAWAADSGNAAQGGIEETYSVTFDDATSAAGFLHTENDAKFATKPAEVDGSMTFKLNEDQIALPDRNAPVFADGEVSMTLTPSMKNQQMGVLFRYEDDQNWAAFLCGGVVAHGSASTQIVANTGRWWVHWMVDGVLNSKLVATDSLARVRSGTPMPLRVKFVGNELLAWADDEMVLDTYIEGLPTGAGKAGIYVSKFDVPGCKDTPAPAKTQQSLTVDDFKVRTYADVTFVGGKAQPVTYHVADGLSVTVDKTFPRIISYALNGKTMTAQEEEAGIVRINGADYTPTEVTFSEIAADGADFTASYVLTFGQLGVTALTYEISSQGNGVIDFALTDVTEDPSHKIFTIKLVDNALATIRQAGDQYDGMFMAYDTGEWVEAGEEHLVLGEPLESYKRRAVYPFLTTDALSVGAQNNNFADVYKFGYTVDTDAQGALSALSLENGTYIYRYEPQYDDVVTQEIEDRYMIQDLFSCQITVAGDYNSDCALTWQDGAALFASVMDRPAEWDETRDHQMYIAMNFLGSVNPFLRQLDDAKKIYNLTDGFGQRILEKGYQAQGHDDSHPDYGGHIGERPGGKADLNFLASEGEKYNVQVGVHINTVSFQVDAFDWVDENIKKPYLYNYVWVDNEAEPIFERDILSGELGRRLDELAADVPGLDFIYHDVYHGLDFHGKVIADQMAKNGWSYGGEYGSSQWMMFSHGATDVGNGGYNQSSNASIQRFLRNSYVDNFSVDPLLRGARMLEQGLWQGYGNITSVPRTFFTANLPTKYLQYGDLVSWTSEEAKFANGATSVKMGDRTMIFSPCGTKIADLSYATQPGVDKNGDNTAQIFIPWNPETEEKIYHYMGSATTGSSFWSLPRSWSDVSTVKLYQLSDTGRELVCEVYVTEGIIALDVEPGVGYILEKGETVSAYEPAADWGAGSYLKDPGFDSHTFIGVDPEAGWTLDTTNPEVASIINDTETRGSAKGDTLFRVTGGAGEGATISQTMTGLEANKTYEASIWVRLGASGTLNEQRKVTLEVRDNDSYSVSNYVDRTPTSFGNFTSNHSKYKGAHYNKLTVVFTVPEGKADSMEFVITVADGDAADSVTIDDARVWKFLSPPAMLEPDVVFFEDFENAADINGKFIGNINYNHLVEESADNADRSMVIDGSYSLKVKSGGIRTLPQTLRLDPNTNYRLEFDYIFWAEEGITNPATAFTASVKGDSNKVLASVKCNTTVPDLEKAYPYNTPNPVTQTLTFNTLDNSYAYLDFPSSSHRLILDNVKVTKLSGTKTPAVTSDTVAKSAQVSPSVDFTLTEALTGTWNVYASAGATTPVAGITASATGTTLTLTHATDLPAATYYVALTQAGELPSARIALTVTKWVDQNQTALPAVTGDTAIKDILDQSEVTYTLSPEITGEWKVYAAATGDALAQGVTASVTGAVLTLSHATDLPAGIYYITCTAAPKTESERLALKVIGNAGAVILSGLATPAAGERPTLANKLTVGDPARYKVLTVAWKDAQDKNFSGAFAEGATYSVTIQIQATDFYTLGTHKPTLTGIDASLVRHGTVNSFTPKNTLTFQVFFPAVLSNAKAPTISTQPANVSVTIGGNAELSVAASVSGGGTLSYQWYQNTTSSTDDGVLIENATAATYTAPTASAGTTYYYVVVTNTNAEVTGETTASVTSSVASVIVTAPSTPDVPTGGGSTSGTSSTTTKTKKNSDGSTTKTVTDKKTGNVTETTTYPDGAKIVATTSKDGETSIEVTVPKDKDNVTVTIPTGKQPAPGEVAVIVHEDGTREVVKTSVSVEEGIRVTLNESCKLEIVDNSKSFADVSADYWGYDAVRFVTSRELFNGGGNGFAPGADMTRSMLITVLARLDGQDTEGGANWYEKSVDWAKTAGISDGTNPEGNISRQELAVMLYRYVGSPEVSGVDMTRFSDAGSVAAWANSAMSWAVDNGLINGKANGNLDPAGNASRAEVAAILMRMVVQL